MITQKRLKKVLDYNPKTGVMTWLKKPANRIHVGDQAGSLNESNGYYRVKFENVSYEIHRLAFVWMTGTWSKKEITHVNGQRTDNKWKNLLETSREEIMRNRALYRNNQSGYHGVRYVERSDSWRAVIYNKRKSIHLGYFDDKDDAVKARKKAERKLGYHKNHGRAA